MEKVITYDGSTADVKKCRKIQGEYYEMNRQCFRMSDGKWHRINNGKVIFLFDLNKWALINDYEFVPTIVDISDNSSFVFNNCTEKNILNEEVKDINTGRKIGILNFHILNKLEKSNLIKEDLTSGALWFKEKNFTNRELISLSRKDIRGYNRRLEYRASFTLEEAIEKYRKGLGSEPLKGDPRFGSELGITTFGFEIESINGTIAERHLDYCGIIPLRDGSLRVDGGKTAYEYSTVPLRGAKGVEDLKRIFSIASKYLEISPKCSTHVHLGGFEKSKEFVVSLYEVGLRIQDEIFSLFPAYFEDTSKFKGKSYCGALPSLNLEEMSTMEEKFTTIYNFLSGITEGFVSKHTFKEFKPGNHPMDKGGDHKWQVPYRYYFLNLTSLIWGETIEFRCHPPTLNGTKAINWLYITNAITTFAYMYAGAKLPIPATLSLAEIFRKVYSLELSDYLINYTEYLKYNRSRYDAVSDNIGVIWCDEDKNSICLNEIEELI